MLRNFIIFTIFLDVFGIVHRNKQSQLLGEVQHFDPELAQQLYYYTKIAVCGEQVCYIYKGEFIEKWDCGFFCNMHPRMTQVKVFQNDSHNALGYVGYDNQDNRIIVAFRSTQNIHNFLSDMKFLKVDYPCVDCQVHRGFLQTYKDLQDRVLLYTESLTQNYPKSSVTVLGHSLGAALATFSAIDMQLIGINVKTFYIFGQQFFCSISSPRVGNKAFRDYFQSIVTTKQRARITHYQDIVPHLPPMNMDYHHVVQEYWFDKEKHFIECDSTCEDPGCSNSNWKTSFTDHMTYFGINYKCGDNYYKKISETSIKI